MSVNRRTFLGSVGAGIAVAAAGSGRLLAQSHRIERLGMQLYTVRDAMAKDFDGTLAKVAALGYKEVEFAGYFDKTPQQVKDALARHGLTSPATHIGFDQLGDAFPKVIEASTIIGHQFIVNPWIDEAVRKQPGIWKRAADTFNRAGEQTQKAGIQFAYHNHHFEFVPVDGQKPLDLILTTCDPKLVKIELDLCWAAAAGQDPVAWFEKYPGRFPMVHVKGLKKLPPDAAKWTVAPPIDQLLPDVADVGPGPIDWARIFAHAQTAGIKHYFVEHDQPKDPFESLAVSAKYLDALRF
jgi:sugar phosphate isomerase/epimerase